MHLKNFSLITREPRVELSPAYDLLNTTIALPGAREEMALPIRGKKSRLTRKDLVSYFGEERLRLPRAALEAALGEVAESLPEWEALIRASFLPPDLVEAYLRLVSERRGRLGL